MTDSDIIHPRNQGGDPEAGFIETWAERSARREKAQALPPKKPQGRISDQGFERRLKALYHEGMTHKRMALELGVVERTIRKAIRVYGLAPRIKRETNDLPHMVEFKFAMPEDTYVRMLKHCRGRGRSMAKFIRELVKRELDK